MSNISRKEAEQFLRSIDNRIEDLLGLDCYNRALNALTELLDKTWEQGFQDHETGAKLMDIMSRDSK